MGKNSLIEICSLFTKANFSRSPRKYFVFILFPPPVAGSTHYVSIEKIHILSLSFWKYVRIYITRLYILLSHTRVYVFVSFYFLTILYCLSGYSQGGTLRKLRRIFFVLLCRYFFSSRRKKFFISALNVEFFC